MGSEDQELWQKFVRRTQPLIANVIINTLRRWREPAPNLVDDLIQETYLKLFANDRKALRGIRNEHENAIFGYFKVAASNTTIDYFRQPKNNVPEIELTDPVVPPLPDGFDRIRFAQLKDKIGECLQNFSSRDQAIFWLYYEQGHTAKEISLLPHMELGIKGVESTLQRLVKFIKDRFPGSTDGAGGEKS
ncbi:MAG TPA: sigma-70 family RNA polymerase sigma factor [Candidatus Angelobacter sp.]|nr:sigma-70 family RNA polymerase sigma factor [Candidatus Angelobacter sp.]